MTNEEINDKAQHAFLASLQAARLGNDSEFVANIAQAIRESVGQAYEEAAQKADARADVDSIAGYGERRAALNIANDIRALKDSLVLEPASS